MLRGVLGVGEGRLGRCEGRVGGRARSQPHIPFAQTHVHYVRGKTETAKYKEDEDLVTMDYSTDDK